MRIDRSRGVAGLKCFVSEKKSRYRRDKSKMKALPSRADRRRRDNGLTLGLRSVDTVVEHAIGRKVIRMNEERRIISRTNAS